jgi:HSP20 family protein
MITNRLPALCARLSRLPAEVDRIFEGFDAALGGLSLAPVNVREEAEAFLVEVELPGVPPDRVAVTVTHGTDLLVEAERPAGAERGAWHRRERGTGRFRRLLRLPLPVEADRVEARLENGVLFLTLPKAEAVRPRHIDVKGE